MNRHNCLFLIPAMGILIFSACSEDPFKEDYPRSFSLRLKNTAGFIIPDAPVMLTLADIEKKASDFNPEAFIAVVDGQETASQLQDADQNGKFDHLLFTTDFAPVQEKQLRIYYAPSGKKISTYPKRTQAEISHKVGGRFVNRKYEGGTFQNITYLRVPPEHTDHSSYIRYEGPGWESDKVGYRFYLDWRNATDIFGKKTSDMVLQNVGQDNFDSYHVLSDWGADVFQVGASLGIGSIAMWHEDKAVRVEKTDSVTCLIADNGPVYSRVRTQYYGWQVGERKIDLTSDFSIWSGSRLTHAELMIHGNTENICTGLAKHANTVFFEKGPEGSAGWGYIALWGKQSLVGENDELGIAVLYPKDFIGLDEDELNHVVILRPVNNRVEYYFAAAWVQEPQGITGREAFEAYLDQTVQALGSSIEILDN